MTDQAPTSSPSRNRARAPEPGPVQPFDPPAVRSESLSNGLALRLAPRPRLPVAAVALVLDVGETVVPRERAGLAGLTARCLEGGTARRDGAELAEALEGLGTELRIRTGWDGTTLSLTCLAHRLPEAFQLLAEVVQEPSFPDGEVERAIQEKRAALRQRRMDPSSMAADAFLPLLYSSGSPYSRPLAGSDETLDELQLHEVAEFAHRRFGPKGGGVVVAGDVDAGEVEELTQRHFGNWDGGEPSNGEVEAEPAVSHRRVVVLHRPGAVQSEIRIGHVGVARSTPDYHALRVGNAILGGAFTSRLNLNLRERHGFTYGVRSRFAFRRGPGPFSVSTAVSTDVTADAVREAVTEIEGLIRDGPTGEEVEQAKDYVVGVFPLRFETSGQVAARAAELLIHRLPDDEHVLFRDRIRDLTREEVAEALARRIQPAALQVLVVGDAEEVRGPLEALDQGPVEVQEA